MHDSSRRQAMRFLRRRAVAPDLSPTDAAWLLLFFQAGDDRLFCGRLVAEVQESDREWLQQATLFDVCLRLLALFSYDRAAVDGVMVARLANRLLVAEQAVGGPYCDDAGKTDVLTNAMIAQLFVAFGTPLPNVAAFLRQTIKTQPAAIVSPNIRWLLTWPHVILSDVALPDMRTSDEMHGDLSPVATVICLLRSDARAKQAGLPAANEADAAAVRVRRELAQLDTPLRADALAVWQSVVAADPSHEITTLPQLFAESLYAPGPVDETALKVLGIANFYTWMAYTIYDDFIDSEAVESQLPAANVAHRAALRHYQTLEAHHHDLMTTVWRSFNAMDAANAWELAHCRFVVANDTITIGPVPRYGTRMMLAKRAGGHALGASIVMLLQPAITVAQRRHADVGLDHYLIAKQLNDDLHDWRQDMRKGHISPVVALLLRAARVRPGVYPLDVLCNRLQEQFWRSGLEEVCGLVIRHATLARRAFEASAVILPDGPFLETLLARVERTAYQAIAVHSDQKAFLRIYGDRRR